MRLIAIIAGLVAAGACAAHTNYGPEQIERMAKSRR
jgi:hypothetical protein